MTVSIPVVEKSLEYSVLHILPFDSVGKRMSVVVEHPGTRQKLLVCKGADSSMLPCLARPQAPKEQGLLAAVKEHLEQDSKLGLRVLIMGQRVLGEEEYRDWAEKHNTAENSLEKMEKLLLESYNSIDNRMHLLGATGIEDRLQEGVPQAFQRLRQAGIVVWVLMGDKQETAINIAYSCRLFSQDMQVIKLNVWSPDAA